jgi:methionyl-tRNA formyltransferase
VRICIAATPSVAIPTLDALISSEHEIVSVITRPDAPAGRGQTLQSSAVSDWADANKVKVYKPESAKEIGAFVSECDLVITIGFGVLLPEEILKIPKFGFINLHFSLLPRWRGAAPVQRALEAGDRTTGVTVFKLDAGMDTGPVYTSRSVEIDATINSADLLEELAHLGVSAVLDALVDIQKQRQPLPQTNSGATRAAKLTSEEAQIDWTQTSISILNKVRAFYLNPGAWTTFREIKIKLEQVAMSDLKLESGQISVREKKILVGTGDGAIELVSIKPAGKAAMSAQAWANGQRLEPNDRFENR